MSISHLLLCSNLRRPFEYLLVLFVLGRVYSLHLYGYKKYQFDKW